MDLWERFQIKWDSTDFTNFSKKKKEEKCKVARRLVIPKQIQEMLGRCDKANGYHLPLKPQF